MAQKVSIELVDDIDGTPITDDSGKTVSFGFEGAEYEIDLNETNQQRLRDALGDFIAHGRKVSGRRKRTANAAPRRGDGVNSKARQWAQEQGYTVNERGRVPTHIIDQYQAAQRTGNTDTHETPAQSEVVSHG